MLKPTIDVVVNELDADASYLTFVAVVVAAVAVIFAVVDDTFQLSSI